MSDRYVLKNGVPVEEPNFHTWSLWFEHSSDKRRIAKTKIGEVEISTCFLALDHAFSGGPPLLYETMIFGGALDGEMIRTATLEEAKAGHDHYCARVIAGI